MDGKMDWNTFILNANKEYDTDDEDWAPMENLAVIRFDNDKRGNISGMYKGRIVFRYGGYENTINPGDIWICDLVINPKSGSNYFAKPVQKVDSSFFYEMKKDQINEFAVSLWETNRDLLQPYMDEKYKDILNEKILLAVEEQTTFITNQIDELSRENRELKRIGVEDKGIIESKEKQIEDLNAKIAELESKIASPQVAQEQPQAAAPTKPADQPIPGFAPITESVNVGKHSVIRSGPDMIRSDFFNKSRYAVYLSADHSTLLIKEKKNGQVVCIDNTLMLEGLNTIYPFTEEYEMIGDYDRRYGGLLVNLK